MKINYKYGIKTISGKLDDLVHSAWNKGRVAIGRIFVMPRLVTQHFLFRDIKKNLAVLWSECSVAFKEELKQYALQRIPYYTAEQIPAYANYAHFIRFLYNYRNENPAIDLAEVTKAELELDGCPNNVTDIVLEGFLPPIPDSSAMTDSW